MLARLRELAPSVVRTVTPWIVGFIVTQLAKHGIDWKPSPEAQTIASGLVGSGYYAIVRILETRGRQAWGWLLGKPGAPTYGATAQRDPDSPTGEVAAPESLLPTGTPVETVPADEGAVTVTVHPADGQTPEEVAQSVAAQLRFTGSSHLGD